MHLLIINPNTTVEMTDRVVAAARTWVAQDVKITGATSGYGLLSIEPIHYI